MGTNNDNGNSPQPAQQPNDDPNTNLMTRIKHASMKALRYFLLLILVLICVQFITYYAFANRALVSLALRLRPYYTHFPDRPKFDWVCLTNINTRNVDPHLADRIKEAFEKQYDTVYFSAQDIPEEKKVYYITSGGEQRLSKYDNGYKFNIHYRKPGFMRVTVSHRDWVGARAAYNRQALYVWVLYRWVRIHTCYAEIA